MGLCEAFDRRRKRELEQLGAMMATAFSNPKKIGKVVTAPESRLHGGRRRRGLEDAWWRRGVA